MAEDKKWEGSKRKNSEALKLTSSLTPSELLPSLALPLENEAGDSNSRF
jgi:hypothetical protein